MSTSPFGTSRDFDQAQSNRNVQPQKGGFALNYDDDEDTSPTRSPGKKLFGEGRKTNWTPAIDQTRDPNADPTKPVRVPHKTKKHNERSASSMGMARVMSNPQDSAPLVPSKAAKFIMNSDTTMKSLAELDRKSKHAIMRVSSNVFAKPDPTLSRVETMIPRKGGARSARGTMGTILAHNDGLK